MVIWEFRFFNSTGSNSIEKDRVGVLPGLVWGNRGGGVVGVSVPEVSLDNWANGDVFFMYGEYGFSTMGI